MQEHEAKQNLYEAEQRLAADRWSNLFRALNNVIEGLGQLGKSLGG